MEVAIHHVIQIVFPQFFVCSIMMALHPPQKKWSQCEGVGCRTAEGRREANVSLKWIPGKLEYRAKRRCGE